MNTNQGNPRPTDLILGITREVLKTAYDTDNDRPSSKALLAFADRLAGSFQSIVTLINHHPEREALRAVSNDCAAIRRCMYDALLQMRWIADGPNDPDEMGKLYLDFRIVENYKLMNVVLSQNDAMSQRFANSPAKNDGHARLRENYKKVKDNYPNSDGKRVRTHWYSGNLAGLAEDLSANEEYTWFVRVNNSSVHTGPRAMFDGTNLHPRYIELLAESILVRGLGVLAKHDHLHLSDPVADVIAAHSTSRLSESFR